MSEELDLEALAKKQKRAAARLRRELRPSLEAALANEDGFARLLAISDEEWQAALDTEEEAPGGA